MRLASSLHVCLLVLGGACSAPDTHDEPAPLASVAAPALAPELLGLGLPDLAGDPHSIAEGLARGNRVAVVFWQSWCAPCIAEAPHLAEAHRGIPDLEVLGVVSGPDAAVDEDEVARTVFELGLPYPSVRDRTLELTDALEVKGTPTIVVVGEGGRVLFRGHRAPEDWDALR